MASAQHSRNFLYLLAVLPISQAPRIAKSFKITLWTISKKVITTITTSQRTLKEKLPKIHHPSSQPIPHNNNKDHQTKTQSNINIQKIIRYRNKLPSHKPITPYSTNINNSNNNTIKSRPPTPKTSVSCWGEHRKTQTHKIISHIKTKMITILNMWMRNKG